MSDHDKLRDAIADMRAWCVHSRGLSTLRMAECIDLMAKAAESTLPKTKMVWIVEGAGRPYAPYARTYEAENRETLNSYVECLHSDGFSLVTITSREVPA